jgi:fermentation-respiration switch protein FrsA (DUF1100 family)
MPRQSSTGIKWAKRAGIVAAVAYASTFAFGCACADSMIFPAPRPSYDNALTGLVKIPGGDGAGVAGLWIPRVGAKTAILYFHGNGEDLGYDAAMLREIGEFTGCSVLGIDYPGYGLTPGKPSEDGCYAAADAAFVELQKTYGYTPDNIVVFGRSLGTGVAVDLAARHNVKGLILVSPFTSTFRVITKVKLLPIDRFDSLAKIDRVRCPLLIVHGERDEVIPFTQGNQLFEAAENAVSKKFLPIPDGRHNDGIPGAYAEQYGNEILRIVNGTPKPSDAS